ncbi:hypothetical protein PIB30_092705 [Stylosanthes scabra]|uniref:Uncharacterized protein n=1 Tax=Stylosanthes scabra TaxID=79078 RepID=A0ABU6ZTR2_9FABA|nr:hypothetical protein [Stylosanthes scabra]
MGRGDAGTSGAGVQGQEINTEKRRADLNEDAAREQEMFWEETLEEALAGAVQNERNLKRPPPSHRSPLRPHQPEDAPNRNTNESNQPPPTIIPHTMRGPSLGTTSRFQDFMPTPRTDGGGARTWPLPHFKLPASTTMHQEWYSGSSNSSPNN